MTKGFRRTICTLFALGALGMQVARAADFNIAESRKSVVYIRSMTPGHLAREGSGFIVSKDGIIYTNRHVVVPEDVGGAASSAAGAVRSAPDGANQGTLILVGVPSAKDPDQLDFFRAEMVYASRATDPLDFAILKIVAKPTYPAFRPLAMNFGKAELGASVAVMGYPYVDSAEDHPSLSFNKGTVSNASRKIDEVTYCQTDAAVNPGNSGGPLITTANEVVGIVTAKKLDAENIGFAMYLSEAKKAADQAMSAEHLAAIHPEAGPLDSKKLPLPVSIPAVAANWKVEKGSLTQNKGSLTIDDNGRSYWLVSGHDLPENFQITIPCASEFLPTRAVQPTQQFLFRDLVIRFASDDTKTDILETRGYYIRFAEGGITLQKEGSNDALGFRRIAIPQEPMLLMVMYKEGAIAIKCDEITILTYKDPNPRSAKTRLCIGGFLSQLTMGPVEIVDLDTMPGATVPTEVTPGVEKLETRVMQVPRGGGSIPIGPRGGRGGGYPYGGAGGGFGGGR